MRSTTLLSVSHFAFLFILSPIGFLIVEGSAQGAPLSCGADTGSFFSPIALEVKAALSRPSEALDSEILVLANIPAVRDLGLLSRGLSDSAGNPCDIMDQADLALTDMVGKESLEGVFRWIGSENLGLNGMVPEILGNFGGSNFGGSADRDEALPDTRLATSSLKLSK